MKGESRRLTSGKREAGLFDAEGVAVQVLQVLTVDPERLGRFLSLTGLDPTTIRTAARDPGFLGAVLDHLAGDEALLLAVASEAGLKPDAIMRARDTLSPTADWGP